jgi:hypothetical protein
MSGKPGVSLYVQMMGFVVLVGLCLLLVNVSIHSKPHAESHRERTISAFRNKEATGHIENLNKLLGAHHASRAKNLLKHGYQNSAVPAKDVARMHSRVSGVDYSLHGPFANEHNSTRKDRITCPEVPAKNYPVTYGIRDITDNWNADDTQIPPVHFDSLCHFDYVTEYHKAERYQRAELPFVVYNYPDVDDSVREWSDLEYLRRKIGKDDYKTEVSDNNHFMFFRNARNGKTPEGWKPPTTVEGMGFDTFIEHAVHSNNLTLEERDHMYFRVSGAQSSKSAEQEPKPKRHGRPEKHNKGEWLYDSLKFFSPGDKVK